MSSSLFDIEAFRAFPLIGIFRNYTPEEIYRCAEISVENGMFAVEVTMNTAGASEIILELRKRFDGKAMIGAGTVCTISDLEEAIRSEAQFIVTPIVADDVLIAAKEKNIPLMCGAYSPTEIYRAWSLGADCVKVFPSNTLGPNFIKDLHGPFPQIRLMPTGSVSIETVLDYKKAGAAAYGLGSCLYEKARVSAKDWDWVAEQIRAFRTLLA
jgi:2-dehydro-3-deoxyphosphogluconate aldolase/(4S)-4-hydroxy-2-oxoglutarate aldolase